MTEAMHASAHGGTTAVWRGDGKEHLSLDGTAMAVDGSARGVFQAGVPKALFKVPQGVPSGMSPRTASAF